MNLLVSKILLMIFLLMRDIKGVIVQFPGRANGGGDGGSGNHLILGIFFASDHHHHRHDLYHWGMLLSWLCFVDEMKLFLIRTVFLLLLLGFVIDGRSILPHR